MWFRGQQQSFGLPITKPDKHPVDMAFLDHYATTQWEAITHQKPKSRCLEPFAAQ
jgi:hypothetical protein